MWVTDAPLAWGGREPSRAAVVRGSQVLTYGELRGRVLRVAAGLGRACDETGTDAPVVAFRATNSSDFLVTFLGVVAAGGVAAPVGPRWTLAETEAALARCPASLCIGEGPWPAGPAARSLAEVEHTDSEPGPARTGGSRLPFYVGFSSGSTGVPKAVVRDHDAWLKSFVAMTAEFGVGPGTPVAVPGDLFFSFSLIAALHALTIGATVHLPATPGVAGVLPLLARGVTAYVLPSVLDEVARYAEKDGQTLPEVRQVICAGERLRPETRAAAARVFPRATITEYYGASELGFVTVMPSGEAATRPGSVGRAFAGSEVAVLGEDGRELPTGSTGLLCVRNEYGGAYLGGDADDVTLDHCGWRTVGDLAWRDADGFVTLAGRRDSMLVIRGENVYPEQVEAVIAAVPGVRAVGVTAVPVGHPVRLVAVIAADEGVTGPAILEACRRSLSGRRIPRRVAFVASLPLTATGKLDRMALLALAERGAPGAGGVHDND